MKAAATILVVAGFQNRVHAVEIEREIEREIQMMAGKFREYNWNDIVKLIFEDVGLLDEPSQRTRGELWHVGGFNPPEQNKDTCVRVQVYDKPFDERFKDHAG